MKVKTSELSGAALDWMVWVCAGGAEAYPKLHGKAFLRAWRSNSSKYLNPSTEWAQGGPIIERKKLTVAAEGDPRSPVWVSSLTYPAKVTFVIGTAMRFCSMRGPTPLVAACRCYVASEMGDEVDVPEELLA